MIAQKRRPGEGTFHGNNLKGWLYPYLAAAPLDRQSVPCVQLLNIFINMLFDFYIWIIYILKSR